MYSTLYELSLIVSFGSTFVLEKDEMAIIKISSIDFIISPWKNGIHYYNVALSRAETVRI